MASESGGGAGQAESLLCPWLRCRRQAVIQALGSRLYCSPASRKMVDAEWREDRASFSWSSCSFIV